MMEADTTQALSSAPFTTSGPGSELSTSPRPRIAVIGTGGTFAMHGRHRFDWIEYADSGVIHPIGELLTRLGELAPDVEIVPIPFRSLGSAAIGPADWLELAALIRKTAANDPQLTGFVVTHGTATLEETAWFLELTLALDQPIVLTGAQRPANTDGSDAAANLRGAVAVASAPSSRGAGVLVTLGGLFFSARDVTKAASFELGAFEAPPYGPLGRVDADARVVWRRRMFRSEPSIPAYETDQSGCPARRAPCFNPKLLDSPTTGALPRVDLVTSYAGADGTAIDAFVAAGARGIVCAGLAPGRPASGEMGALRNAVQAGVVVVQATRASRGVVPVQRFLQTDGILAGGDLGPSKLRIALMLALAVNDEAQAAQGRTGGIDIASLQQCLLDL